MKLFSILLLLSAGACMAQQPVQVVTCVKWDSKTGACIKGTNDATGKSYPQPAPLKCGKWTHFEPAVEVHVGGNIFKSLPDRCAPDLHTVTEKEWQELMARLKRLEHPPISATMPFIQEKPQP